MNLWKGSTLWLFLVIFTMACQSKEQAALEEIRGLEALTDSLPNASNMQALREAYAAYADRFASPENADTVAIFLTKGARIATSMGMTQAAMRFREKAVKTHYTSVHTPENVLVLTQQVLRSMKEYSPQDSAVLRFNAIFPSPAEQQASLYALKDQLQEKVFDTQSGQLNKVKAVEYARVHELLALSQPETHAAPGLFMEAARFYTAAGGNQKALQLYTHVLQAYPTAQEAPKALFLQASELEEVNEIEAAREAYQKFLLKYPNHELADDAQAMLENAGKSPEEIIQSFNKRRG